VAGAAYSRSVLEGKQTAAAAKAAEIDRIRKILSTVAETPAPAPKVPKQSYYAGVAYGDVVRVRVPHDGQGPPAQHWENQPLYIPFRMGLYAALLEASTGIDALSGRPSIPARDWLAVVDKAHHWGAIVHGVDGDVAVAVRKEWPEIALDLAAPYLGEHHKQDDHRLVRRLGRENMGWLMFWLIEEVRLATPKGTSRDSREEEVKAILREALIGLIEKHAERLARMPRW
jgi:hypothetical protein